jgi:WD40 repeat protein
VVAEAGGPGFGRRAVTIGVARFDDPHEQLPFAPQLVRDLSEALRALGYETTVQAEARLASAGLGAAIRQHLDADDADGVLIVHAVTHGVPGDGKATIYLLGSDGEIHTDADVAHWLTSLQNVKNRPMTLFLLDFCQAGTVARLPWQSQTDRPIRGWVIAASRGDRPAYDGRFTRAAMNVLHALAAGDLDIDPVVEHVPLDTVAQAIRREVNRLAAADDAYPQQVTATLVDMSVGVPDLPFFPNPAHRDDPRIRLRAELEPGLLPFFDDLDEGLDARHFVERAAGVGPLPESARNLTGCFTGRADELRTLSPWMSGEGDTPLYVVTGSPGVGKSALLGILVCAAHPLLREHTRPLWKRIAQRPLLLNNLVAVHARRRDVADVTMSLSRQLHLDSIAGANDLVAAITRFQHRPVIVVDALDEADNSVEVMSELLLPLATSRRPDGTPAVRLLVGVRRYEDDYLPLLEAARNGDGIVDLDDVPAEVLEDDLHQYVTELLRTDTKYRRSGAAVGEFATEVARALSEQDGKRREWGEFLVAGLYSRYLLAIHPKPPVNAADAKSLGAGVPRTLPEVLDLDLSTHRAGPLLRQVVTILAHARGQGMPLTVITRLAATAESAPTTDEVRRALQSGRFYLRQSTDSDASTLYRLFHQGLADHLRQRSIPDILTNLLASLGPANARNWQAAEPYLLRHAPDHAADVGAAEVVLNDVGFLLQPDPAVLLSALDGRLSDVYRASLDTTTGLSQVNRTALALNAARAGMTDLAKRIVGAAGEPALAWYPYWTVGKLDARPQIIRRPVAVTGDAEGTVRVWDLASQQPVGDPMTGHDGWVDTPALGELDGRMIAVTGGEDGTVRVWDLASQQPVGDPMTGHSGWVAAPAIGELMPHKGNEQDRQIAEALSRVASGNGFLAIRSLAISKVSGRSIGIFGTDSGGGFIVDLATGSMIRDIPVSDGPAVVDVVCDEIAGRPIAILTNGRLERQVWDLLSGEAIRIGAVDDPLHIAKQSSASALIVVDGSLVKVHIDARDIAVVTQDGSTTHLPNAHEGALTVVRCTHLNDRPVALTGGQDGRVIVWDLLNRQVQDIISGLGPVFAIEVVSDKEILIGAGGEAIAFRYEGAASGLAGSSA